MRPGRRLGAIGPSTAVRRRHAILGAPPGEEPLCPHESSDAIAPSWAAQSMSEPWAAIGLAAACKLLVDARTQVGVLDLAQRGFDPPLLPIVIAAARDQERFA